MEMELIFTDWMWEINEKNLAIDLRFLTWLTGTINKDAEQWSKFGIK